MGSNFPCHHKEREIVQRETARKTKDHFSSASSIENQDQYSREASFAAASS